VSTSLPAATSPAGGAGGGGGGGAAFATAAAAAIAAATAAPATARLPRHRPALQLLAAFRIDGAAFAGGRLRRRPRRVYRRQ